MRYQKLKAIAALLLLLPFVAYAQTKGNDLLIGSWLHSIKILGQPHDSIITFWSDGAFREDAIAGVGNSHILDPFKPLNLPVEGGRRGQWKLLGEKLIQTYHALDGAGRQGFTEVRLIRMLTDSLFVSADERFNIEIERRRVIEPIYFETKRKQ